MELRQLKYFLKAAEYQNFTKAAKALNIAESSLSTQIRLLESELNVLLFSRIKKQIELTESGIKFLNYARTILVNVQEASTAVQDINELRAGNLRIGGIFSLSSLLTETLVSFSSGYPDIRVKMVCKSGKRLFEMLHNNELDFVLTFESPQQDNSLECIELFRSPLAVFLHKDHTLAQSATLSLSVLREYPLALPERGMHIRDILEERFAPLMQELNIQLELNDVNILYQLVCAGHWLTVLPQSSVLDNDNLRAIKLSEKNAEIQAAIYWRKGSYHTIAARKFLEMLQLSLDQSIHLYRFRNNMYR